MNAAKLPELTLVDADDAPSLAEVLAALSRALDLTEGQPAGHAVRSAVIGMRLGREIGLDDDALCDLHYALLLKDAGCSSNAAKMFAIFGGDETLAKRDAKIIDWTRAAEAAKYALAHTSPGEPFFARARKLGSLLGRAEPVMHALTRARCDRGAKVALALGLGERVACAIHALDEHWDGNGAAIGRRGGEIPPLARVLCLAQTVEVFAATFGAERAVQVARERSGTWFEPDLVRALNAFTGDAGFWHDVRVSPEALLRRLSPERTAAGGSPAGIDAVCDAFARIVDAKSSFTAAHSSRVCGYALEIAGGLGIDGERKTTLRRAALLHDLGKLAVPNLILDKPGKLTDHEFARIQQHPRHTAEILHGLRGFERVGEIARAHHERLNGRGYYQGLAAERLDLDMRILAVADVFDALTAERPYRAALPPGEAFAILDKEAGTAALDADCVAVLKQRCGGSDAAPVALPRAA